MWSQSHKARATLPDTHLKVIPNTSEELSQLHLQQDAPHNLQLIPLHIPHHMKLQLPTQNIKSLYSNMYQWNKRFVILNFQ